MPNSSRPLPKPRVAPCSHLERTFSFPSKAQVCRFCVYILQVLPNERRAWASALVDCKQLFHSRLDTAVDKAILHLVWTSCDSGVWTIQSTAICRGLCHQTFPWRVRICHQVRPWPWVWPIIVDVEATKLNIQTDKHAKKTRVSKNEHMVNMRDMMRFIA